MMQQSPTLTIFFDNIYWRKGQIKAFSHWEEKFKLISQKQRQDTKTQKKAYNYKRQNKIKTQQHELYDKSRRYVRV